MYPISIEIKNFGRQSCSWSLDSSGRESIQNYYQDLILKARHVLIPILIQRINKHEYIDSLPKQIFRIGPVFCLIPDQKRLYWELWTLELHDPWALPNNIAELMVQGGIPS